jgi:two-component system, cell cycle response regulator DivK
MKHVLMVEDDPHNAVVFHKILERRAGCRVTICEDANEILRVVRSGEVDLVMMDVSLGNTLLAGRPVNGVELCRMLKSDRATAHVPVVLATAHAMRGDSERLLAESGADGYVAKPIMDHAAFASQILKLLEEAA